MTILNVVSLGKESRLLDELYESCETWCAETILAFTNSLQRKPWSCRNLTLHFFISTTPSCDDLVSGSELLAADCVYLADYTKSARLVMIKQFSTLLICIGVNRGYCQNLALSAILF